MIANFQSTINRIIAVLLLGIGLLAGCSKSNVLAPDQFTLKFAKAFHRASPDLEIGVSHDLELTLTPSHGQAFVVSLNEAYDLYKRDPSSKAKIFQTYIAADQVTVAAKEGPDTVELDHIIPIVKEGPWVDDMNHSLSIPGDTNEFDDVHNDLNDLNPDLIFFYAEISPKNNRYLKPENLRQTGLNHAQLRALAAKNLMNLIPQIQRHGTNGFYALDAGGDYEASLLLVDSVWTDLQKDVRGDVVVAIPTSNILMVTGSQDEDGLGRMKKLVAKAYDEGAFLLTDKLFVYRNGQFTVFTGQ